MDREILKELDKSTHITKDNYKEICQIFAKVIIENYSEKKIMKDLLHKANFDIDVFWRYWLEKSRENIKSTRGLANHEKAKKYGFDRDSAVGGILVGLVDNFYNIK